MCYGHKPSITRKLIALTSKERTGLLVTDKDCNHSVKVNTTSIPTSQFNNRQKTVPSPGPENITTGLWQSQYCVVCHHCQFFNWVCVKETTWGLLAGCCVSWWWVDNYDIHSSCCRLFENLYSYHVCQQW